MAFVTGAAGGIGAAIAERLRTERATVVTSDLGASGVDVAVDVTDRAAVRAAIARVVADHGHLDLAVACASAWPGSRRRSATPTGTGRSR